MKTDFILELRFYLLCKRRMTNIAISSGYELGENAVSEVIIKGIGTKTPLNGGLEFALLTTKLCARLQFPDLFMNRPEIKFLTLRRAS